MAADELAGLDRLRRVVRALLSGGLLCLLLPLLAWLGSGLYERLAAPADAHLPGLLSALLVLYVAPLGVVLLVLAVAAGLWAWWLGRQE